MKLKEVGKKLGDIAFKLAMSSCERGGGCDGCVRWGHCASGLPSNAGEREDKLWEEKSR